MYPVAFDGDGPQQKLLYEASAAMTDEVNTSGLWAQSRDLLVATRSTSTPPVGAGAAPYVVVTMRSETDVTSRASLDAVEWVKWHVMGETLAKVAAARPNILFLHQWSAAPPASSSKGGAASSATAAAVSAARWPSPVLRHALRALGSEAVRSLVGGLLENMYSAARLERGCCFALACAVKVVASCVTLQRALGFSLDAVVAPFVERLVVLETAWACVGTIGHRIGGVSALAAAVAVAVANIAVAQADDADEEAAGGAGHSGGAGRRSHAMADMSGSAADDVCAMVSRLKRVYHVPGDLFA